jgi:chromosome segregation ATPase
MKLAAIIRVIVIAGGLSLVTGVGTYIYLQSREITRLQRENSALTTDLTNAVEANKRNVSTIASLERDIQRRDAREAALSSRLSAAEQTRDRALRALRQLNVAEVARTDPSAARELLAQRSAASNQQFENSIQEFENEIREIANRSRSNRTNP